MRSDWALFGIALAVAAGIMGAQAVDPPSPAAAQPIAFNHKIHADQDIACSDCHRGVETSAQATLPPVRKCMLCHADPKGSHPDEPKIREFAGRKAEIPWVRVNRLPRHVFFSHRRHVALGKIDCAACHGDAKSRVEPFTRASFEPGLAGMERCVDCHRREKATTDCQACHR